MCIWIEIVFYGEKMYGNVENILIIVINGFIFIVI